MNQRLQIFESYASHPWLHKVYRRLRPDEMQIAHGFLSEHWDLDKGAFELAVNRMFLDKAKPKNYREILELLTCCNSAIK